MKVVAPRECEVHDPRRAVTRVSFRSLGAATGLARENPLITVDYGSSVC